MSTRKCIARGALFLCFLTGIIMFFSATPGRTQVQKAEAPIPQNPSVKQGLLPAAEIPQEEAFARMKELNDKKKLVSTFLGPQTYSALKQENCHGWRLRDGTRLLWESSGESYGLTMTNIEPNGTKMSYQNIGIIFSEANLRIGNKLLKKGPYMVYAALEEIELATEEGEKASETFALRDKLDPAQFDETAKRSPDSPSYRRRAACFLKSGKIRFLSCLNNRYRVAEFSIG